MRRFAHYDYWADTVMPSILVDSRADLLIFAWGKKQTEHIARELEKGVRPRDRCKGVCYLTISWGFPPTPCRWPPTPR